MSRTVDPGRAALLRYLSDCMRAELRAQALLLQRRARTQAAKRQLADYDREQLPSPEQMLASARAAKRRNIISRRAR